MSARAAPMIGAVLGLALFGAGTCHALSLRGSAAELFLEDASPGAKAAATKLKARLRVENSGAEKVRVEIRAGPADSAGLKDGYDPWPYMNLVSVRSTRSELKPGEGADIDVVASVPAKAGPRGQYQFDVLETGRDAKGGQLTLRTRVLIRLGEPLARADDAPVGGWQKRPGFTLSPKTAASDGRAETETTVKFVNAEEEDLTVTLKPTQDQVDSAEIGQGDEPGPNPDWMSFEPATVHVPAGSIAAVKVKVIVPKQRRYAGRQWTFTAAADAEKSGKRSRLYFVLHVNTEHLEEEKRVR